MKKMLLMSMVLPSVILTACITITVPEAEIQLPTSLPSLDEVQQVFETAIPEIIQEVENAGITFESQTYADGAAGFELQIPADWYAGAVEELERGYSTTFQSWVTNDGGSSTQSDGDSGDNLDDDADGDGSGQPGDEGEGGENDPAEDSSSDDETPPADETKLTVEVMEWEPANNLNAFLNYWREKWADEGEEIVSKQEWNINLKRRAILFVVQDPDGGLTFYFFTGLKDKYLVLTGVGDITLLVQIAKTVKLSDF